MAVSTERANLGEASRMMVGKTLPVSEGTDGRLIVRLSKVCG